MKINKIFFGLAAAVLTLGFTACQSDDDFLNEHSYSYDSGTIGNTQNEIEMALNACYQDGSSSTNGGIQYMFYGPNAGHNYYIFGPGLDQFAPNGASNFFNRYEQFDAVDNGNGRHWYDLLFNIINYANTVIDMIDEHPNVQYSSATKKDELLGEARFIRGWCYRNLAGFFGRVPLLEHHTTSITTGYTPAERQQVWEFAKADFEFAEQNMPKTPRAVGCPFSATAGHYLAEIDLALGDFDGAIAAASRVINKNDGDVQLMTTRFGVDASKATDRYGHPLNAYWDLFRVNATNTPGKSTNQDYSPTGNKEALWTAQYSGSNTNYSTGGGGMTWWRVRGYNQWESAWNPGNLQKGLTGTKKVGDQTVYTWTNDAICYPDSTLPNGQKYTWTGRLASRNGITGPDGDRYTLGEDRIDSLGGGYSYIGNIYYINEHTQWGIWGLAVGSDAYKNVRDFRGSEAMMQRNWYTAGGKGVRDTYKKITTRTDGSRIAPGSSDVNQYGYTVTGGDTISVMMPRLWKISTDEHPNGDTRSYPWKLMIARVAETYLIRAEAYLAKGDKQSAANDINALHDRVGAPRCTAADVDIDYILDERTRELFGEEHRLITLNRLSCNPNCGSYVTDKYPVQNATQSNTLYERVRKYGFSYTNITDDQQATYGRELTYVDGYGNPVAAGTPGARKRFIPCVKPWEYQYPIPGQVIDSNTGAEYPQNPGYAGAK